VEDINAEIKIAIIDAHRIAEEKTDATNAAKAEAIEAPLLTAALVEKCSRWHKQDLRGFLSEILTPEQIKDYKSGLSISKLRDVASDKRALQKFNLLPIAQAPKRYNPGSRTRAKPSLSNHLAKLNTAIAQSLQARPVASLTKGSADNSRPSWNLSQGFTWNCPAHKKSPQPVMEAGLEIDMRCRYLLRLSIRASPPRPRRAVEDGSGTNTNPA